MIITDEVLNRYLDGELSKGETAEVEKELRNSESLQLKFKALSAVHGQLKKMETPSVSPDFTFAVMKRINYGAKSKKEQKYFIFSISTIFIIASLIILGFVLSSIFSAPGTSQITTEGVSDTLLDFSLLITNFFSSENISILGSIISGGIIITAYFYFESLKHTRKS